MTDDERYPELNASIAESIARDARLSKAHQAMNEVFHLLHEAEAENARLKAAIERVRAVADEWDYEFLNASDYLREFRKGRHNHFAIKIYEALGDVGKPEEAK